MVSEKSDIYLRLSFITSFVFIGLSLGFIVGMSTSPIASSLVASILTIIIPLLIAVSQLSPLKVIDGVIQDGDKCEQEEGFLTKISRRADPRPLAIFMFFLAIGAAGGVYVRANNLLIITKDSPTLTVLPDPSPKPDASPTTGAYLYTGETKVVYTFCDEFIQYSTRESLQAGVNEFTFPDGEKKFKFFFQELSNIIPDDIDLVLLVQSLCS